MRIRDRIVVGLCIAILGMPICITEYIKDTMEKKDIGDIKLEKKAIVTEEIDHVYITPTGM